MTNRTYLAALALGTALSLSLATPALAQGAPAVTADTPSDIIVTARRVEERLQDVPISITVFNQQQLANQNILSATDLAVRTPSLSSNNNFGDDNTTFAIRGFAQDIGTQPSVGTYFGDVVTPRGASNGQPVGDGASAGDFFDLSNVQVLKGPQGTLFGRNTTGGAVLFVPQRPTSRLEGYVQGSYGDYDMKRVQAVLNVPVADNFRARIGIDRMKRDGYLHNISGIGPRDFNNTDYWAVRGSVVGDLTPNLENYLIASWSQSKNHGALDKLSGADATQGPFGAFSVAQIARQGSDFYNVENPLAQAGVKTTQWQIIDTTTWRASDTLTLKNIASYAELKQVGASPIFGVRWPINVGGTIFNSNFQQSSSPTGLDTAHESTFTEEFRLAGNTSDDKFSWQTGAYLEVVSPLSQVGSQSPAFASCRNGSNAVADCTNAITGLLLGGALPGFSPATAPFYYNLVPAVRSAYVGSVNFTEGETSFHNVGLYAQGTYKITEKFSVTGGIRYTWDRETINTFQQVQILNLAPIYGSFTSSCTNVIGADAGCNTRYHTKSKAPTWLIDVDYKPTQDILVYAKYARGYRAATIAPNIPEGGTAANPDTSLNYVKPEKVDAYEVGAKTSFRGAVHGTFNIAGFYNNFSNQQLQVGFLPLSPAFPQTAAPVNAGKSKIYGAEIEATLTPVHGLDFDFGYTYLRTRIDQVSALPSNFAYATQASFKVGDPETLAPRNKLSAGASYTLPLGPEVGRISVGGTVTYRSSMLTTYIDRANPNPAIAALGTLPSLTLVDGNVNWHDVAGKPIDLGFFVTNLTNKKYYNFSAGLGSPSLGFEVSSVGAPRMYGVTAKIRFGR
jgi:iron complex outermembrane receptor protein